MEQFVKEKPDLPKNELLQMAYAIRDKRQAESSQLKPGYLGTFGKGFKSELTMGYGMPDELPKLEGIGEKVAYGAGALAGMLPSFAALSTVTTPAGGAILRAGRIGKLINRLHKVGKVYKVADKAGKVRDVSKLGMAVEGAAKSGALFAAHGAVHELPPGEEGVLARAKIGAEAVPMGMAFGAAAPLAGGRRLAQIGTAAGIGAGATAISGGTTEDILIQGGLLGAMSALHISVKDAHSFAKQIAGEVDKLPAEQRQAKIDDILYASREDRLDFARTKAETAPSETDLIREDRLSFAQERAKDQPMGVPGDSPAPEIEVPGAARRPAGPKVGVRGAFGMRARPEPRVEPTGVPEERFVETRETPEQIEAGRLEAEGRVEPEPGVEGFEKMSLPELLSAHEKGGAFNVENKAPETTWGEPCRAKFEELTGKKWSSEIVKEAKRGVVPEEKLEVEKPEAVPEEITAEVIRARLPEDLRSFPVDKIAFQDLARVSKDLGIHPQTAHTVLKEGEKPAAKITKLDIEPEKIEEPKVKVVPEKEPEIKSPGEGQLYKKTLAEIHKDPDILTSQGMAELHEHRARVKGFEKAGGSFVEGYLNKLAQVAEKMDMNAATAAYNALSLYRKGEFTQASLKAEKVLGRLHKAEKETWTKDRIAELHKEDIKKALAEGKTVPPEVLAEYPDLVKPEKPIVVAPEKPKVEEHISALLSSKKKAGVDYEMEITVAETGETVTVKKDAAIALRETKKELSRYEKFLECLK